MKTRLWFTMAAAMVAVGIYSTDFAFGRGGRGGGGGFSGGGARGGGGGARPSGGGVARPSGGGGARPSVGSSPSFSRPSAGGGGARATAQRGTRPSVGSGARPSTGAGGAGAAKRPAVQPGTRPKIGAGTQPGTRPSTLPGTRPGAGTGQGNKVGIINAPGAGAATRLPGLETGAVGSRLPNQGAGLQDRAANRPQTLEERQSSLNDRLTSGREDRQSHRQEMQGDRQDWRDSNRKDWQNFADDHHDHHGDWYHDCWQPGDRWNYMWDNYPVAAAFGVTAWGVNRLAYGFGYWGYSNPYATTTSASYDYSQPLVVYSDSGTSGAPVDPAAAPATTQAEPTDAGMAAFNDARTAFYEGDAAKALTLIDTTLTTMPRDTVVHEFRGLVLFALKKYPESSAAIYAVLSAGPGWDWTTMSSLYPSVEDYTQQLRALEDFVKANPKSADAHFLLGYHYLTATHADSASKQFKLARAHLPDDKLLTQLVGMTTPPDELTKSETTTPPEPPAVPSEKVLSAEKLVGTWKASSQGAAFQLDLAKDGSFVWTYSRGKDKQSVKGVFAVDQNNLALEPDAGGTMLAEVDLKNPSQFLFKMIGGDAKDPGLQFKKG